jgi:hypothetical protein
MTATHAERDEASPRTRECRPRSRQEPRGRGVWAFTGVVVAGLTCSLSTSRPAHGRDRVYQVPRCALFPV